MPIHGTVKGPVESGKRKAVRLTGTAVISTVIAMFIAFATIHMSKVNSKMASWDTNYKRIEEDMQAFKEVSAPKTIRLYVKELNKILDDVTFLGKIVESGQTSAASLDSYFNEYEIKLEHVIDGIERVHSELTEIDSKFKEQVTRLTGETDDNLLAIQGLQDVTSLQNKLSDIQDTQIKMIEDDMDSLKVKLDRAKETFVGKHVFKQ